MSLYAPPLRYILSETEGEGEWGKSEWPEYSLLSHCSPPPPLILLVMAGQ